MATREFASKPLSAITRIAFHPVNTLSKESP